MKTRTVQLSLPPSILCVYVCVRGVCVFKNSSIEKAKREKKREREGQSLLFILSKEVKVSLTEAESLLSNWQVKQKRKRATNSSITSTVELNQSSFWFSLGPFFHSYFLCHRMWFEWTVLYCVGSLCLFSVHVCLCICLRVTNQGKRTVWVSEERIK